MKWRIKDKELRVRIDPEDKEVLENKGKLSLELGPIILEVQLAEQNGDTSLQFFENKLICHLPKMSIEKWLSGKSLSWKTNTEHYLILVEKDLSCSHSSAPLDEKKYFGHKFD